MAANFTGDLTRAVIIARPEWAVHQGLSSTLSTELLGARGGSIGGIPVLTTKAPADILAYFGPQLRAITVAVETSDVRAVKTLYIYRDATRTAQVTKDAAAPAR